MIYKVSERFQTLRLGLRFPGCNGQSLTKGDFAIVVQRVGPGTLVCRDGVWDEGCGRFSPARQREVLRIPGRRIKYPAFEIDAQGRIVFLWDDKIIKGEPGRWEGELHYCNKPILTIQLQVGEIPMLREGAAETVEGCAPAAPCDPCQEA